MRLCILSQWYRPEPVPKPSDLAEKLISRGNEVTVVTGLPNYPSGELYRGYKARLFQRETLDNVPIIRTYLYAYHGTRAMGRIWNYISFMLSAPLSLFALPKADLMYVFHPPPTIGFAAFIISRLKRIPFVYDVQDIWPESALVSGLLKPGLAVKIISWMERVVYSWARHILVITEGAKANLVRKGVPHEKISVMPHWVKDEYYIENSVPVRARVREQYGWEGKRIIVFAGNIGLVQGLEVVVEAAQRLDKSTPVKFVLIGEGLAREALQKAVAEKNLGHFVQFIERQPTAKMAEFYAAADVLLVHLKKSELCDYVIPTKTIAYLSVGKPVLMAMEGAAAELISNANAGFTAPAEDSEALARSAQKIGVIAQETLESLGRNGRSYYLKNFTAEEVIAQYERLFLSMAA